MELSQGVIDRIYKSSLKFLESLNHNETLITAVDEAVKLVDGEYGSIFLKTQKKLTRAYASQPVQQAKVGESAYQCFSKAKPVLIAGKGLKPSAIYIPLTNKKKAIGVLEIYSKKNQQFLISQMQILELFSAIASLAIRKTQLYDEAKDALEIRDMFISMASHELRTPITTISGYAQLLQSRIKPDQGVTKIWVDELAKEVHRLILLVKELLEINRIKSGNLQFNYKEASMTKIIDRAVKAAEFANPTKKVVLENNLGSDDVVIGDFDKLLQALNNILENAAKYSPNGKTINLILSRKNKHLKIVVKDRGIGITEKELPNIFSGYARGGNHNREGLGLGLFLAKSIIDKHLGSIKIKSTENKGTVVEILLPKAAASTI